MSDSRRSDRPLLAIRATDPQESMKIHLQEYQLEVDQNMSSETHHYTNHIGWRVGIHVRGGFTKTR